MITLTKNSSILKKAIQVAKQSDHPTHRMGAVVFNKKTIISSARNYSNRSVKHLLPKFQSWKTSIHAEIAAVLIARRDVRGCSMLVVRINKKGDLLLAKPCEKCQDYMDFVGIKTVYYSTQEGKIERM